MSLRCRFLACCISIPFFWSIFNRPVLSSNAATMMILEAFCCLLFYFLFFFVLAFYSTSPPQLYPQIRSICRFITPAHLPRPNPLAGTFLPQDLTYPSPPLAAPCRRLHRGWRVQPRCRRDMPQSCPPPKPVR